MGLYVEGMLFPGVLVEWKMIKRKKGKELKSLGTTCCEREERRQDGGGQEGDNKNR